VHLLACSPFCFISTHAFRLCFGSILVLHGAHTLVELQAVVYLLLIVLWIWYCIEISNATATTTADLSAVMRSICLCMWLLVS
jgi:hypothetical protein